MKGRLRRLVCWNCGVDFVATRDGAYLCGPRCRKAWSRARKAGTWHKHLAAQLHDARYRWP